MNGRISEIVPFFPFNHDEQAVTTYRFMRQLWNKARAPINTERKWFPGQDYVDDERIATWLAKDGYNVELGARSLESAGAFFGEPQKVNDSMNDGPLPNYDVRKTTVSGGVDKVTVGCTSVRNVQQIKDCGFKQGDIKEEEEEEL